MRAWEIAFSDPACGSRRDKTGWLSAAGLVAREPSGLHAAGAVASKRLSPLDGSAFAKPSCTKGRNKGHASVHRARRVALRPCGGLSLLLSAARITPRGWLRRRQTFGAATN